MEKGFLLYAVAVGLKQTDLGKETVIQVKVAPTVCPLVRLRRRADVVVLLKSVEPVRTERSVHLGELLSHGVVEGLRFRERGDSSFLSRTNGRYSMTT